VRYKVGLPKLREFAERIPRYFRNWNLRIGFTVFSSIVLMATIGPFLIPYNPVRFGTFKPNLPPDSTHLLGTDSFGRDVLAQMIIGTNQSLQIAITAALIGTFVGMVLGFMAGYYGGFIDAILRSITDIWLVIPMLPMLILIASMARRTEIWVMSLVLSLFSWAWPARQVRGQTLSLKNREFIYMAKLSGMGNTEIIFTEIVPHMLGWILTVLTSAVLWAMMAESGLEILGLGPQHTITLGMMLYWSNLYASIFRGLWWWWSPTIVMLILIFTSLYIMHIGVTEIVNPRAKKEGR